MKLHDKLQKLRKERGYSQEQLANLLNVSRQTISKWESGTIIPTTERLQELCSIYQISLAELLDDSDVAHTNSSDNSTHLPKIFPSDSENTSVTVSLRHLGYWIIGILMILLCGTLIYVCVTLSNIKSRVALLEAGQTQYISVSEPKEDPLTLDYWYEFLRYDDFTDEFIFELTATPKKHNENDSAAFLLETSQETKTIDAALENGKYRAEARFPSDEEDIRLYLQITSGTDYQTQDLESPSYMLSRSHPMYDFNEIPVTRYSRNTDALSLVGTTIVRILPAEESSMHYRFLRYPVEGTLRIRQGDAILWEVPLDLTEITKDIHQNHENALPAAEYFISVENINENFENIGSDDVFLEAVFIDNWGVESTEKETISFP